MRFLNDDMKFIEFVNTLTGSFKEGIARLYNVDTSLIPMLIYDVEDVCELAGVGSLNLRDDWKLSEKCELLKISLQNSMVEISGACWRLDNALKMQIGPDITFYAGEAGKAFDKLFNAVHDANIPGAAEHRPVEFSTDESTKVNTVI